MHSPRLVLTLALVLLSLAAMPASAQTIAGLSINAPTPSTINVDPDQSQTVTYTVQNTGSTDGTVSLTRPVLAGWTTTLNPSSFALAAGQSRTVTLTVTAPSADAAAPTNGRVNLDGTISAAAGQTASATSPPLQVNYVAPPPPVVPTPPTDNSWVGWLVGVLSFLVLVAAGAGFFLMRSRSVTLGPMENRKDIDRGTGDAYPVRVENKSRNPRTVQLRVAELPPRWVAAFSFPEVKLQPKESTTVPVFVRVPGDTPTGSVGRVRVQARSGPYTAWMASADLLTTVTDVRGERPNAFPEAAPKSVQGALDQLARST